MTVPFVSWWRSRMRKRKPAYTIGCYYFPGWSTPGGGPNPADPWALLRAYPDRVPLSGAYDETAQGVVDHQLQQMSQHGIGFVAVCWFWDGNRPHLSHWIDRYLASTVADKPKFCILFANSTFEVPKNAADWRSIYRLWMERYTSHPKYFRIDDRPVAFVFDVQGFIARLGGVSGAREAVSMARAEGGFYFVGTDYATVNRTADVNNAGFDAMSQYSCVLDFNGDLYRERPELGYGHLVAAQESFMSYASANFPRDVLVPIAAGWHDIPWNASSKLKAIPTDAQWRDMLLRSRAYMDAMPDRTRRTGMIYAWNEFGEGGWIEPTPAIGFTRLRAVAESFK